MTVHFVGAGPGDPELLTRRAERLLASAEVCIYAGSLVSPAVLALCPPTAELHDSAALDLDAIIALMEAAHRDGKDVVRLHTGDPSLYGAIGEQVRALTARSIPCQVVPGVSSFQAAAAALTLELTAPEVSQTVILARVAGRTPVPERQSIERLASTQATLCLFLSVHKLGEMAGTLAEHYGHDCPVAVVYRASWPDEQIVRGTLRDIGERVTAAGIERTAMVIVGHALHDDLPVSKLYDARFAHGYRPARAP